MGIGLIVLLAISALLNLVLLGIQGASHTKLGTSFGDQVPKFTEQTVVSGNDDSKIAVISLKGVISSSTEGVLGDSMVDDLKLALGQASRDASVKAVILSVDSPGGEVTASDIIYHEVTKLRAKKPVVVYMGSLAASGGYYISCGGSWIVANETTLTGSIGVIISTVKYKDLLGKIGVEPMVFKSGKFKDMLSGSRDMTPEENEYIQGMVMQTYGKFVGIVAAERHLPEQQLRDGIADGRVISGKDALNDKLINQLGYFEDAVAKARELAGVSDAEVVSYKASPGFGRFLKLLGQSENSKIEVNLEQKLMPSLEPGRLYMLPSFYAP
ncbi:MAG: signal peptide peptidase SppA [Chthoniobacteraceae bacterium]